MIPDGPVDTAPESAKTAYKSVNSDASDTGLGERVDECAHRSGKARVIRLETHGGVLQRVGRGYLEMTGYAGALRL